MGRGRFPLGLGVHGHGTEHVVPERRAHPEGAFIPCIVVQVVVAPKHPEDVLGRVHGMHRVVYHQVGGIAGHETATEGDAAGAEHQPEEAHEQRGHHHRDHGGQCQPLLVPRVVVVDPVHHILEAGFPGAVRCPHVVEVAVRDVFDEGEEQGTGQVERKRTHDRESKPMYGNVSGGDPQAIEDGERDGDVRTGEGFQDRVLEDTTAGA